MTESPGGDVTILLQECCNGRVGAPQELMSLIYAELRALAAREMLNVPPKHTLQPTALVHEAYLRLFDKTPVPWANRRHFFWAASRAMHDILVEYARKHLAQRRGGNLERHELSDDLLAREESEKLIGISDAVKRLEQTHADAAQVVMLRFFGGLSYREIAELVATSEITVRRRWLLARAWLHQVLSEGDGEAGRFSEEFVNALTGS